MYMHWFDTHIAAWLLVPVLAFSALFGFQASQNGLNSSDASSTVSLACTMEAKQCPDGSWVGRSGSSCAFAACPSASSSATSTPPHRDPKPVPVSNIRIYSITPKSGLVGTEVTVDGFGFMSDNTIHFGSGVIMHVPITSSIAIACTTDPSCVGGIHQSLTFAVPTGLTPACFYSSPRCMILTRETTPGNYEVSIENANGGSKTFTFEVTGAAGVGAALP